MKHVGTVLLAAWLLASGLLSLLHLRLPMQGVVLAALAVAAGVFLLIETGFGQLHRNLGMLVLALWLIGIGLLELLPMGIPHAGTVFPAMAVAAGALLLLRR